MQFVRFLFPWHLNRSIMTSTWGFFSHQLSMCLQTWTFQQNVFPLTHVHAANYLFFPCRNEVHKYVITTNNLQLTLITVPNYTNSIWQLIASWTYQYCCQNDWIRKITAFPVLVTLKLYQSKALILSMVQYSLSHLAHWYELGSGLK